MKYLNYSGIVALGLCLSLTACNVKGNLAAYLHKTDAAPEPAASSTTVEQRPSAATASAGTAANAAASTAYVGPRASSPAVAPSAKRAAAKSAEVAVSPPTPPAMESPARSASAVAAPFSAPAASSASTVVPGAPAVAAASPVASSSPELKGTGQRNVAIGGGAISGGNVSNAARVIAAFRRPLRECYSRETGDAQGTIRFTIKVGSTGAVVSVNAQPAAPFSGQMMACATATIRAAKFDAPESGAAQVAFPADFRVW